MRIILAAAFTLFGTLVSAADLITKESPHTVAVTLDRLSAAVEKAGAKVFARVDHAKGAASVGKELRPTEMLMFGNPALGTPAIEAAQTAGLDLPLRAVQIGGNHMTQGPSFRSRLGKVGDLDNLPP